MGELAAKVRERLGPIPERAHWPLVSIVVLNRNGGDHLKRLLRGLVEHTDYPSIELILVDNASSDDSLAFIRGVEAPFPIAIVANPHNESFSDGNNQGAQLARGELLLFLNNDIEPFESGWLRELVDSLYTSGAGVVGATLIDHPRAGTADSEYVRLTRPLHLQATPLQRLGMVPNRIKKDLFAEDFGEDIASTLAFGACILISSDLFRQIGGFTHGYFYGGEDSDLFFKVRSQGLADLYSGRTVLIHRTGSTTGSLTPKRAAGNNVMLKERWAARLWRECELERLSREGRHDDKVLALSFCLKADQLSPVDQIPLHRLESELERRNHRYLVLRDADLDDGRGFTYDVAVHLRGTMRYIPGPGQLNVLWVLSHFDALTGIECRRYDLVVTEDAAHASRLREDSHPTPVVVLNGDDPSGSLIDAVLLRSQELDFPTRLAVR